MKFIKLISLGLMLLIFYNTSHAQITEREKRAILDAHNQARADIANGLVGNQPPATNMVRLEWDNNLFQIAQKHTSKCNFVFNEERSNSYQILIDSPDNTPVGELLYRDQRERSELITNALDSFISFEQDYEYNNMNECIGGGFGICGIYTQLAWANTQKLGCGITFCETLTGPNITFNDIYFLSCNYFPAGNFFGQFPYLAGDPASNCPEGFQADSDGLCTRTNEEEVANVQVPLPIWALFLLSIILVSAGIRIQRWIQSS